jgi:hypothetical protein
VRATTLLRVHLPSVTGLTDTFSAIFEHADIRAFRANPDSGPPA